MENDTATYNEKNSDIVENNAGEKMQTPEKSGGKFDIYALLAILLAVAGWVTLAFEGRVALGVSILSFVAGCIGLKASTRTWRNFAITSLVASSVLIVVVAAFLIVIYIGLNSI